jgi:hypothetical protein
MIGVRLTKIISTLPLTAVWCATSVHAEVPAGDSKWSSEQTWGKDSNHGGEALKGFYVIGNCP